MDNIDIDWMEALSFDNAKDLQVWAAERGCLMDPQIQAMLSNLAQGREVLTPANPALSSLHQRAPELGEPSGLQVAFNPEVCDQNPSCYYTQELPDVELQQILKEIDASEQSKSNTNSQEKKSKYYNCTKCSKKILTYRKRNIHEMSCGVVNKQHNQFTNDPEIDAAVMEVFSCKKCNISMNREEYFNHMKKKHSEKKQKTGAFACIKCSKTFARQYNLDRHLEVCKIFKCDSCGQNFKSKRVAERKNAHNCTGSPKKFSCNTCGKTWIREDHFNKHKCNYPCTRCKAVFRIHRHLKEHLLQCSIISHQYDCKVCSNIYIYYSILVLCLI